MAAAAAAPVDKALAEDMAGFAGLPSGRSSPKTAGPGIADKTAGEGARIRRNGTGLFGRTKQAQ